MSKVWTLTRPGFNKQKNKKTNMTTKQRNKIAGLLATRAYIKDSVTIFERVETIRKSPIYLEALEAFKSYMDEIRALISKSPYNPGDILNPLAIETVFNHSSTARAILGQYGPSELPDYKNMCKQAKQYLRCHVDVLPLDCSIVEVDRVVPEFNKWLQTNKKTKQWTQQRQRQNQQCSP